MHVRPRSRVDSAASRAPMHGIATRAGQNEARVDTPATEHRAPSDPEPITEGSSSIGACTSEIANVMERPARAGQLPSLDRRQLLPDRVHLGDRPVRCASSSRVTAIFCVQRHALGAAPRASPTHRPTAAQRASRRARGSRPPARSARAPDAKLAASGSGCPPSRDDDLAGPRGVTLHERVGHALRRLCRQRSTVEPFDRTKGNTRTRARRSSVRESQAASARAEDGRRGRCEGSVIVLRIGPGRQAGDDVELAEQRAHHLSASSFAQRCSSWFRMRAMAASASVMARSE